MTDIERAIAIIEECRQSHVDWAAFQRSNPNWRDETEPDDVGGPQHHESWVEKYDQVLAVLRQSDGMGAK